MGEAGGVAPEYSLISDYFPPEQRARALSVYSFGIPIGSALGIVFGGIIATKIDWRFAFFAVGLGGLIIAPIFKLTVAEPIRGQFDKIKSTSDAPSLTAIISLLAKKPSFWLMSLGAAFSSMMGYGLFFWLPSFLVRSFGLELLDASLFYSALLLIGGIAGTWLGGSLADRFGATRRSAYVKGKTAVVTESTSGIGLGIATALAASGANVMLNGLGDAKAIDRATRTDVNNIQRQRSVRETRDSLRIPTKPSTKGQNCPELNIVWQSGDSRS